MKPPKPLWPNSEMVSVCVDDLIYVGRYWIALSEAKTLVKWLNKAIDYMERHGIK